MESAIQKYKLTIDKSPLDRYSSPSIEAIQPIKEYTQIGLSTHSGSRRLSGLPYLGLSYPDFGFSNEMRTGNVGLRGMKIGIDLHPNAIFQDLGKDVFFRSIDSDYRYLGECKTKYDKTTGKWNVTISRIQNLRTGADEFVLGHEEGHAMVFLGHMNRLYNEARKLGLSFDFMSKYDPEQSDFHAKSLLSGNFNQTSFQIVFKKESIYDENIANLGGLVALIRHHADQNLIARTKEGIDRMQRWPLPF